MAKTGTTSIPITPVGGRRARVMTIPEASVQNSTVCMKGQPIQISGGYATFVTGHVSSIQGFARIAGQNGGSDGAKTASYYLAEEGIQYKGAYSGTLSESVRGLRLNLSVNSAGAPYLIYNAGSSSIGAAFAVGWDTTAWQAGDVNPEIVFTLRATSCQANV